MAKEMLLDQRLPKLRWTEKDLFLGPRDEEHPVPVGRILDNCSFSDIRTIYKKPPKRKKSNISWASPTEMTSNSTCSSRGIHINRFGQGVPENCHTGLYLTADDSVLDCTWSKHSLHQDSSLEILMGAPHHTSFEWYYLVEAGVEVWEQELVSKKRPRHQRRYALAPQPFFMHALGPWQVTAGQRYSVQSKRAVSEVTIHRQSSDTDMCLPMSHRQLTSTVSCDSLNHVTSSQSPTLFWTPDYWYRPKSAHKSYQELQNHLNTLREFHQTTSAMSVSVPAAGKNKKNKLLNFMRKKTDGLHDANTQGRRTQPHGAKVNGNCTADQNNIHRLRKLLRLSALVTAWDFSSDDLAHQIIMIDRELYLKIPASELGVLLRQRSSKNAVNFMAMIAFSHRVSCLISTEILRDHDKQVRARLICRFINTADKCHQLHSFQSCRSVLAGLQSPAIWRLHHTWAYVRHHYPSKYQTYEWLCQRYRDPRLRAYQRSFYRASCDPPYLPSLADLLARLLCRVPEFPEHILQQPSRELIVEGLKVYYNQQQHCLKQMKHADCYAPRTTQAKEMTLVMHRMISAFRIWTRPKNTKDMDSKLTSTTSTASQIAVYNSNCIQKQSHDPEDLADISKIGIFFRPFLTEENVQVKILKQVVIFFLNSQRDAETYALYEDDFAKEFLLKIRYREERENFLVSKHLELARD